MDSVEVFRVLSSSTATLHSTAAKELQGGLRRVVCPRPVPGGPALSAWGAGAPVGLSCSTQAAALPRCCSMDLPRKEAASAFPDLPTLATAPRHLRHPPACQPSNFLLIHACA